ncbi:MAG: type II toxin-antitoxin system RelE/ParE family toxin [Desulfosporosinus sp.]|nr:type II toxin-antitoxin system RelE/ParE family toxin [Desulfosporosinus sp.]
MKKHSILMTHTATEDLKSIASYVANELQEPSIAKKLVGNIKEVIMSLEQMPTRYSLLRDANLASQGMRKIMVDNYVVFYIVYEKDQIVTIVRILHSRRDWVNLL